MPQAKANHDVSKLSFEDAMGELETIVAKLENGQAKLDEAIGLYERGAALRQHCEAQLKEAELRVEKIVASQDGLKTELLDKADKA